LEPNRAYVRITSTPEQEQTSETLRISFAEYYSEREEIRKENEPFGMEKLKKRCAGRRVEWEGYLHGCGGGVIRLTVKPLEALTGNIPLACYACCQLPQKQLDTMMETVPSLKRGTKIRVRGILGESSFNEGDSQAYLSDCEVVSEAHDSTE